MKKRFALLAAGLMAFGGANAATTSPDTIPDIPFTRFQLPNGLTVVVHEDHKAPVVAVSIWYHVGSADEPAGKTGFAHLFEHLMFSGSENRKGTYFQPFDLATTVLGGGKTSRLYQRLVYQDKLADDVSVGIAPFALASQVQLTVDVKNGVDPAKVEAAIADVWKDFLAKGPTDDELVRAKVANRAGFIRGLEKVGGSGKASILAEGQVYRNDPEAYKKDLERAQKATAATVLAASKTWLGKGDYTLTILPAAPGFDPAAEDKAVVGLGNGTGRPAAVLPEAKIYTVAKSDVDRSKGVPSVDAFPDLTFPKLQRGKLKNGIEVVLAERHTVPVTHVSLLFNAGYAADQGRKLGTASFTSALLDESTKTLDSVEVARRKERLGAIIGSGCTLDNCSIGLNALNSDLTPSLELFADVVRNPAFKSDDIERVRGQWIAGIAQEKTEPTGLALRTLPPLIYGKNHAYGIPFTGSGTEKAIASLTAEDLSRFQNDYLRPDNVRILVAGDTTLAEILPKLDAVFGDWKAPASTIPARNIGEVAAQPKPRVFLINRTDAPQSLILAGLLAPSTKAKNALDLSIANGAFGGTFTSRLNMNLREEKRWAYGAGSMLSDAQGQRPMLFYAPVQTDKTAESAAEILKEAKAVIGPKPLTDDEIGKIRSQKVRALPGSFETTSSVLGAMTGILVYDRPDDYVQTLKGRIEGVDRKQAEDALSAVIHPDAMTWVIVGDLRKIEAPVRALNLGEVHIVDADGNPAKDVVKAKAPAKSAAGK